jgi:tRNA1Val (adenine37-N6)-methyltransferase
MKVGSDGVLLGAWATPGGSRILDVGTGTGLIALMMAQRNRQAIVDAIDIDLKACLQASENAAASPFANRIYITRLSLADFALSAPNRYDLIISNPPYFKASLKSLDPRRAAARHDDNLPLEHLLRYSAALLAPEGRIALILPSSRDRELRGIAVSYGLKPIRATQVQSAQGESPKRILYEFSPEYTGKETRQTLAIRHLDSYTDEYRRLTADFYLKL